MTSSLPVSVAALALLAGTAACASNPLSELGPATPTVEYLQRQEVLTPLPVRVRMPAASGVEHVVVLYRTWGSRGWHPMELARRGQTWSGEISCREVSTVTGDTRYFFVALDAEGNPVGGSGSPDWPHVATIVGSLPDGAQGLSGGSLPMRCHDVADCPPDFPGCPAYDVRRHSCRAERDCSDGQRCGWDGYCDSPSMHDRALGSENDGDAREEQDLEAAVRSVRERIRKTASAAPRATQ